MHEYYFKIKKGDIEFECSDDKLLALGDRDAIHQVFYNLFDNAIKFSRESGRLAVSLSEQGEFIKVVVNNEGEGISAEDLPFVFERFYKSDKSLSKDRAGAGLGLYISKTIIDAHGETIGVDFSDSDSCEFWFTLTEGSRPQKRKTSPDTI